MKKYKVTIKGITPYMQHRMDDMKLNEWEKQNFNKANKTDENEVKAEFKLIVDNDTIPDEIVKQIISYAGNNIGIGSFRPVNNGHFGRFELVKMTSLKT